MIGLPMNFVALFCLRVLTLQHLGCSKVSWLAGEGIGPP